MQNQVFQAKTEPEKRRKLEIVLRQLAGDQLTGHQRHLIAQAVGCQRQYSIQLCREPVPPADAEGLGGGQKIRRLIFSNAHGTAAVLAQCRTRGEQSNTVYIYLPPEKEEQRDDTRQKEENAP